MADKDEPVDLTPIDWLDPVNKRGPIYSGEQAQAMGRMTEPVTFFSFGRQTRATPTSTARSTEPSKPSPSRPSAATE
ncbi:MAG: hypothetical protein AB7G39_04545 [Alphaproteobacteria bacterium]